MIKKRWCFAISFLLISFYTHSQGGFNLRIPIEGPSNIQSVYPVGDSLFVCAGFSADLEGDGHLDFELLRYNYNGVQLDRKSYDHPECYGNAQEDCDSESQGFYVQFEQSIFDSQFAHRLYYFDDAMDTLFTRIVQSPYKDSLWDDAEFMYSQYAVLAPDSCLFYSFGVWKPETTGNDVCIKKYSPNGEELWTYIYESDAEVDVCYSILPQPGGGGDFCHCARYLGRKRLPIHTLYESG